MLGETEVLMGKSWKIIGKPWEIPRDMEVYPLVN
jgi:hypothetical protein